MYKFFQFKVKLRSTKVEIQKNTGKFATILKKIAWNAYYCFQHTRIA